MTCLETAHIDFRITRKATCALKSEKKTSQWSRAQALCYSHSKLLVSLVFYCSKPYQLIFFNHKSELTNVYDLSWFSSKSPTLPLMPTWSPPVSWYRLARTSSPASSWRLVRGKVGRYLVGFPFSPKDVVLWSSKRMLYSLGRYSWV